MKHPKFIFLFTFCLFLFVGASVVESKIVFCLEGDICVMNDDGSGKRKLTNDPEARDDRCRWSPDGKRVTFVRYKNGKYEVFTINANGTGIERITDGNYPAWSPDGKKIVFRKAGADADVHVIDLLTRAITKLTETDLAKGRDGSTAPDWSPDGKQIVFERFISREAGFGHKNIYVMSANGEQQRPLLPDPPIDAWEITMRFQPRWSSDGQHILFDDCTQQGDVQMCKLTVLRIGGKTKVLTEIYKKLGDNVLIAGHCWIRNDKAILFGLAFKDKPKSDYDIYQYDLDTKVLQRLTQEALHELSPDWIEGPLSVPMHSKKAVQWGQLKK